MQFQWSLCDLEQGELARLSPHALLNPNGTHRPGAKVGISRHAARSASITLSLADPALADVAVGSTLLKCVVDEDWLAFVGRVVSLDQSQTGEDEGITINALDPWAHLAKCQVLVEDTAWTPDATVYLTYTAAYDTDIMWALINSAVANEHGVVEGLTPNSVQRTITYPAGSGIADSVLALANLDGGSDFELTPLEATNGDLATFNAYYPRQGSDKTATVIVKFGLGDDDNAIAFGRTPSGDSMVNQFTAIGDVDGTANLGGTDYPKHAAYVAKCQDSIDLYGVFEGSESMSGTTDANILAAHAKSIVAANAYPAEMWAVTLDPDTGADFSPGGACWMGDTIAAQVHEPHMAEGETRDLEGRIANATLTEQENGQVIVSLNCEPELYAGVTGAAVNVVVDNSQGTVTPPPGADSGGGGNEIIFDAGPVQNF